MLETVRLPHLPARQLFRFFAICAAVLAPVTAALAHHPGANLDAVMGDKEKFFQAVDLAAPAFELVDAKGEPVRLGDFAGKIVVVNFIYAGCLDVCPLHSEKIAEVQGLINASPMKDRVQFLSITTDPDRDTPDVLAAYGEGHGLDAANWMLLTRSPGMPEDTTRRIAKSFGLEFTETPDGQQMHGIVTHVIDRDGRLAARFHGLRFESVNLVLYINALTNNARAPAPRENKRLWERVLEWF